MNTSVSILFYIKRAKANNLGVCPIYTRVTVNAKRFEFSTNKFINPEKWSSEGTKVKGSNEDARTINSHLDYLKNQVLEAEKKLFKKDISITSENIKNELFGLSETKRMPVPVFKDHNNIINVLVCKDYAQGILKRSSNLDNLFCIWSVNSYKMFKIAIYMVKRVISYLTNDDNFA